MEAWPSISCTVRMSAPQSSMWVAQEWRSTWGVSSPSRPASAPRRRTTVHTPWRVSRPPRWFKKTASASPRRAQRRGSSRPRPSGASQRSSASAAQRPTGTIRSLEPLPITRASPSCRSTSASDRPVSSEMRQPVPYITSRMARSRRSAGSSPATASTSEATWAAVRALGRPRRSGGISTSAAGSSARWPSAARNRCRPRTATRARVTDAGASPTSCSPRTKAITSPESAPAGPRPRSARWR